MPFGLTNAPATFQATMNDIFRPYLLKFVLVFFDDILVYSSSWQVHLSHLATILDILTRYQFHVNLKKCTFGQRRVDYLGHVISEDGVAIDPEKTAAVLK